MILKCKSMLRKLYVVYIILPVLIQISCTKLKEDFRGDLTGAQLAADTSSAALLRGVYNSLHGGFTSHLAIFPLMELTTDAAIAPTRGQDWDDNGAWRALHQHKWDAGNSKIRDGFNGLNGIVYAATDFLKYNASNQSKAEVRFLRALAMFLILDMYDKVPYRDPGETVIKPARVRKGIEALEYIISELNTIDADLPEGPAFKANKYAAKLLLMKCYLNKGVYKNRTEPVFDAADMNKVISLADEIINSNKFILAANYFDNFSPDNTLTGKENIFTLLNEPGTTPDNLLFFSFLIPFHYNQFPAGTNGFTSLSEFYNRFEAFDKRREMVYAAPGAPPNPGNRVNLGFLVGPQYNAFSDVPLTDGTGAPLSFTPEVKNIETGPNLEVTGIRPLKYALDYSNNFSNLFSPGNDFVFFRLSDVLLMKAEAILRGGTSTNAGPYGNTALSIVNFIRLHPSRGASALIDINPDILLDERGRELWWEGWRRQDMIRFKKYLLPFQEKNYTSESKYLIFPIPDDQLSVNPNLIQNSGY
jgi:hypothetical protein